jgi:prepilin-type N-terminal cleavage/methylation domain-containing protein/prepilin-type processing-associated H-X9-DG protein
MRTFSQPLPSAMPLVLRNPRHCQAQSGRRQLPTAYRAFTLVELLVVIAIIGILTAMTLPAIQASRETARRSQCLRNLSRLSVAIQSYEMAHEVFPPGVIDKQGPIHTVAKGDHRSWIVHLLPYLEETNAYRHIDQTVGVYDPKNEAVRSLSIAVLECPTALDGQGPSPASNYAAVHHDVEAPIDADNHGTFFLNSRLRYDDITDGPSHTLFLGEKLCDPDDLGWMSGTRATLRNTGSPLNTPLPTLLAAPANTVGSASADSAGAESPVEVGSASGAASANGEASTAESAQSQSSSESATSTAGPAIAAMPSDPTLYVGGFASSHSAGANFAFGDGSVRFISEMINLQILQQLAHRHDGKLLPAAF